MRVEVGMRQAKKVHGSGEVAPGECSAQQAKVRPKVLHMKQRLEPRLHNVLYQAACPDAFTEKSGGWGNRAPLARTFAQWRTSLAPLARTVET